MIVFSHQKINKVLKLFVFEHNWFVCSFTRVLKKTLDADE